MGLVNGNFWKGNPEAEETHFPGLEAFPKVLKVFTKLLELLCRSCFYWSEADGLSPNLGIWFSGFQAKLKRVLQPEGVWRRMNAIIKFWDQLDISFGSKSGFFRFSKIIFWPKKGY